MAKKKTTAEKKDRAQKLNEYAALVMMSSPQVNGNTIKNLHQKTDFGEDIELDVDAVIKEMKKASEKVNNGDLSNLEDMLTCQAHTLQNIFLIMTSKISGTTQMAHIDLFTRFALKAQNQCRSTIATLSEMKNPKRATFIKQMNQAHQMQVNNGKDSEILKKNPNPANELLEQKPNEQLDTRATQETGGNDPTMAAVEAVNRA